MKILIMSFVDTGVEDIKAMKLAIVNIIRYVHTALLKHGNIKTMLVKRLICLMSTCCVIG